MKKWRIEPAFTDDRGSISDIFYDRQIDHVAIIRSAKGVVRGSHYHKETTQWMFMTKGRMHYAFQNLDGTTGGNVMVEEGEIVETPPFEIHELYFPNDNTEFVEFMVFATGKRGGEDYESDTFRVPRIRDYSSGLYE